MLCLNPSAVGGHQKGELGWGVLRDVPGRPAASFTGTVSPGTREALGTRVCFFWERYFGRDV